MVDQLGDQAGQQRHRANHPILPAAEVSCALSTGEAVCTDRKQREADSSHHRSGHDVRNQFRPFIGEEP